MTKVIGIFLPVFFSALVICAVVLCACGVCQRPAFLTFGSSKPRSGSDSDEGSSATYSESDLAEKGQRPRHSKHGRVVRRERESVGDPGSPHAEEIHVVDAEHPDAGPDAEVIDVVEASPSDDGDSRAGGRRARRGWLG